MTEAEPEFRVEEIWLDDNDEPHVEMAVFTNGIRFLIDFRQADLREPGQSGPSKFELELLAAIKDLDEFTAKADPEQSPEEIRDPVDEDAKREYRHPQGCDGTCGEDPLETWILQPFILRHVFQDMAPAASTPLLLTLQDCINTPTLSFTLKSVNGELMPVQIPTSPESLGNYSKAASISDSLYWSECATVKPENVSMIDKFHPQNRNLVSFHGKTCWFKAVQVQTPDTAYIREIDILIRIEKVGLLDQIRVPRLEGLVTSEKDGFIHGLLLNGIYDSGTLWERRDDSISLRKRWYNDVTRMLSLLHSASIVWGDFKPENMLVDEEDNIWLIDFGGGVTDGWVDGENMETERGDMQGLARLKEFLDLR
jgi:hypothetical protein